MSPPGRSSFAHEIARRFIRVDPPLQLPPKEKGENPSRTRAREILEQREQEAIDQARRAEQRQKDAEAIRRADEQQRLGKAEASQQSWASERDRLRAELVNAQTARDVLGQPDLSTPQAALESVRVESLRGAAGRLVQRAEDAIAAHERINRRR